VLVEARGSREEDLKVGAMVVVTMVVYPLDEREVERDVGGLGGGRRVRGLLVQDLLFCHQTLPRPLITN